MRLLLCCLLLVTSSASANMKIAVFDMDAAIQATSDGKVAKAKLMKEFKFMEDQLKKREFSLWDKIKDFDKKALVLSDKKRQEQQRELQQLSMNFQKDMQKFQVDVQKKQMAATQPIVKKLQEKVTTLANKNGFDLILNKSMNNILWAKKAIDITDTIVKMYENPKS